MSRLVTLVLVDDDGRLLGAAPPVAAALPWWADVTTVAPAARVMLEVCPVVLRLLDTERPRPHGGAVTYLAQVDERPAVALAPVDDALAALVRTDEPLRAPYARLHGPAVTATWAVGALGLGRSARIEQERTWNLSAISRVVDGERTWWLKQLPPFLRAEPAVLTWLGEVAPGAAPTAVAVGDEGRVLQAPVAGDDLYDAPVPVRVRIVEAMHRVQRTAGDAVDDLRGRGLPDRRGRLLTAWIRAQLAGWSAADHPAAALLDELDRLVDDVEACGLPATLVHGDLHPGNVRGADDRLTILDWGEATIGCPVLDVVTLTADLGPAEAEPVLAAWAAGWRRTAPGCDPERAVALGRRLQALRNAALYAHFVANIEPTERRYHAADIPEALDRAVATAAGA